MCQGDDPSCSHFTEHRRRLLGDLEPERRAFLKSGFVASGGAAALMAGGLTLPGAALAQASAQHGPKRTAHYHLPATAETVHWGYFSRSLKPQVEIDSGDYVTIETLTHHANDDAERMVTGDPGAESVFLWTKEKKGVARRGAGPEDTKFGPGRRPRRAYLYRPGGDPRSRARRCPRGPHPGRDAPPLGQPGLQGPHLRQQCRRELGLPLQGHDHRRSAPRGRDDLRGRCHRRARLGTGGLQLSLAGRDRPVRCRPPDHRLSGPAGGPHQARSATSMCSRASACRSDRISARWAWHPRKPRW